MLSATLEVIKAIFGMGTKIKNITDIIKQKRRQAEGVKRQILYETLSNMTLIYTHYLKNRRNPKDIIEELRVKKLAKAIDEGFDFNNIKEGKISEEMVGDVGFLQKYIGYDCEALLIQVRYHIDQLKLLPKLYNLRKTKEVNVKRRLENQGKRYILFTKFLDS